MKVGEKGNLSCRQILSEHKNRNASKAVSFLHQHQTLLESDMHSPRPPQTAEVCMLLTSVTQAMAGPGWQLLGQAQHKTFSKYKLLQEE